MREWAAIVRARLAAQGEDPARHADAIDELAQHLDDVHRTALRAGHDDEGARAAAEAELDGLGALSSALARRGRRTQHRAHPESRLGSGVRLDMVQALRSVRLNPGFSAIVILTLAVGIGACTAVFSVYKAIVLGSLPYPAPDRLVLVWETDADEPGSQYVVAAPAYEDWVREARSFSALGIWEYLTFNVHGGDLPEQVPGIRASASLFDVLGVSPALGRLFSAAEEVPGHRVAVVSDAVWRVHLGADPAAVGRTLRLNGEPFEVIGVMPAGFGFPQPVHGIVVPLALTAQDRQRNSHSFFVAGRLADGVSFVQGRSEIARIGAALAERYEEHRGEGATVTRMAEYGVAPLRMALVALAAAAGLLLLIACVNVAGLQVGRTLTRRREFVLRLSLGAGLGRISRQLFSESLVLAGLAGMGGLALAWAATRASTLAIAPVFRTLPFRGEVPIAIDGAALVCAAFATVLSAVVFGFAPLVSLWRHEPQDLLRADGRGSTGRTGTARRVLVGCEVALAVIVLGTAGLLTKSLLGVLAVDPGLEPREVLTMQVSLPQEDTYGPPERATFCADLTREADGLPGVESVSAVSHLPLSGTNAGRALSIEGWSPEADHTPSAGYRLACPGYFAALGIRLSSGREFTHDDVREGPAVAIVNRALAERYWPGQDPIGRRLKLGALGNTQPWMSVVGVVENVRHFGLDSPPSREIFRPYSQAAWPVMTLVARTGGSPLLWRRGLEDAVRRIDPGLPVAHARTMESVIEGSVSWRRTPMQLIGAVALMGLLLAAIGVYGVLAFYVSQRTREIGVRAALGATPSRIAGLVLGESALPVGLGTLCGLIATLGASRLLQELLFEVGPVDGEVLGGVAGLVVAVALVAGWWPAHRALSINPVEALRED